MVGLSRFLVVSGILLWSSGLLAGEGNLFAAGKWGIGILVLGVVTRLVIFLIPSKKQVILRRKRTGTDRKCTECGRPAVPGSSLCRYHTDHVSDKRDDNGAREYGDY